METHPLAFSGTFGPGSVADNSAGGVDQAVAGGSSSTGRVSIEGGVVAVWGRRRRGVAVSPPAVCEFGWRGEESVELETSPAVTPQEAFEFFVDVPRRVQRCLMGAREVGVGFDD